ncbi:MAG TPA: (Fe-S)-binding protein [Aggregatilineaceae bacterium]|nr:(Fe-S)-binding protein [Aggregatilineaceae bacterium]
MGFQERPSPVGQPVALFVTCLVDYLFPSTGIAAVRLLEHLGVTVRFPAAQACCGQPAYNGGYQREARPLAERFLDVFRDVPVIVSPSGSCTTMIRHEYPRLFAADPPRLEQAQAIAARTWELTEYLVDGLGVTDLGLRLDAPQTFAIHDACHGLRLLGLGRQARALLAAVENARVVPLKDAGECCGFGGLFSVKMPDLSAALLRKKIEQIRACEAPTIVTGDVSCMMHINGGLAREGAFRRVRHIAEVLAEGLPERERDGQPRR